MHLLQNWRECGKFHQELGFHIWSNTSQHWARKKEKDSPQTDLSLIQVQSISTIVYYKNGRPAPHKYTQKHIQICKTCSRYFLSLSLSLYSNQKAFSAKSGLQMIHVENIGEGLGNHNSQEFASKSLEWDVECGEWLERERLPKASWIEGDAEL